MGRREETIRRTKQRVSDLIEAFDGYCDFFDGASLFTGPSLYFHVKTLGLLRAHSSAAAAIQDQAFLESLYATLTAWGLHRMGPGKTKLVDFSELDTSFRAARQQIDALSPLNIFALNTNEAESVSEDIWKIIAALRVGIGETKIVSGSKALHHALPERSLTMRSWAS